MIVDQSNMALNPKPERSRRVALAHDWLVTYRGGEAVLDAIAKGLAADDLCVSAVYTMFENGVALSPALDGLARRVAWINHFPQVMRRWLLPLYPAAVAQLSRQLSRDHAARPVDLLISTSSAAVKGMRTPRGVAHVCYCHAPARYLWSQADQYATGAAGGLRSLGLKMLGPGLRAWDRKSAANVTSFIANSSHTQREIMRCYQRESVVIYPPVRTRFFTPTDAVARTGAWLYAGALEPYKRVDVAIAAANKVGHPLVVVGEGSQGAYLRSLAGPSVTFVGRVSDDELRRHYRAAALLLFPQTEDFGIVAAEAQACGTPVVALRAGGALDVVIEGVTGAFFDEPTQEAVINTTKRVPVASAESIAACRENAERFSEARFAEQMMAQIESVLSRHDLRKP